MSVLSSTWSRLWRSCRRNLIFTRKTMVCRSRQIRKRRYLIADLRSDFVENVNGVLRHLGSAAPRDKFVLRFDLCQEQAHAHADTWVNFCAASRAKHVVFDFRPGPWVLAELCSLPLHKLSDAGGSPVVRSLHIMSASLETPPAPGFGGFTNLKELLLDKVVLGDVGWLLASCHAHESLSVMRCSTLQSLSTPRRLRRLWYLSVHLCKEMQKVAVQAPNLSTFKFSTSNDPVSIVLGGSLKMEDVTLVLRSMKDRVDYVFADLPSGVPHARKLSVDFMIDTSVRELARFPTSHFTNLKHLILSLIIFALIGDDTAGLLRLASVLELAPELPPPHRPHIHLKKVHMTGVYGYSNLLKLVLHFARNAVALERMVVDPVSRHATLRVSRGTILTRDVLKESGMKGMSVVYSALEK
ncbi:hypothetical protein BRADI_1g22781v3 [Brachypodium distachyon]|uniref:At1g61320/AtMIF1 LRR domain-containing protein n=1 Tax=Brachypodium distachyon TaxID=15368 RepID=A0A0Q3GWP4_BRADI|nr:hypothetical protein BRADI_1g22781v3 [Brachypodium distachyon]